MIKYANIGYTFIIHIITESNGSVALKHKQLLPEIFFCLFLFYFGSIQNETYKEMKCFSQN